MSKHEWRLDDRRVLASHVEFARRIAGALVVIPAHE